MNKPLNIVIKPEDYRYGDGHIQPKLRGITTTDWGSHFEFFVPQKIADGDTDDCWDFGGIKGVDAFMDALISQGCIPPSAVQWIISKGFMDSNSIDGLPHFHTSPRFPGVLTGIGQNGGTEYTELDFAKTYGLLPFTMLPVTKDMTLAEYFNPAAITQEMKDIALAFRNLMGGKDFILYQWVNDGGPTNLQKMAEAQPLGPFSLGIPVNVSGWNQVHPTIATGTPVHVVSGYAVDLPNLAVPISDNYNPYLKVLDNGYQISYVLQIIVQYIPPKPVLPSPLPSMPTTVPITQNTVNILTMLVSLYQKLLALVSPTERAKLQGASRSPQWSEVRNAFIKGKACAVCGTTKKLEAHHIKVFHLNPADELDPQNLIALCRPHHYEWGHYFNWSSWDADVVAKTAEMKKEVENRP